MAEMCYLLWIQQEQRTADLVDATIITYGICASLRSVLDSELNYGMFGILEHDRSESSSS